MKRIIIAAIVAFLGLTPFVTAQAQLPAGLHVAANLFARVDGSRFIALGVNQEMFRDYDNGCGWVTDGQYAVRGVMADKIRALGINIVRMNYKYKFLQQGNNLTEFLDMAQELANRGIYVMPSDHSYTGGELVNSSASFPMFLKITQGFRDRGIYDYLLWNPFNEPGGDPEITWDAWLAGQKNALTYLRNTAAFSGVVVLDTKKWALEFDAPTLTKVMAFDAGLRGGASNVAFSFHYYSTNGFAPVDTAFAQAANFPIISGEVGIYNNSPVDPNYVKEVIRRWFATAQDNGHNGLFPFQWAWCDNNGMLQDTWTDANGQPSNQPYSDRSPLTPHGVLWRDFYYSKLAGNVPPPQPTVTVTTPTRTPTRNTPLPTNTRTATRTNTPVGATATPQPNSTCDAITEYVGLYNGKQAIFTTCIRYTQ